MSTSLFVCGHRGCGIPVRGAASSWRHALGGQTGSIPHSRRHVPVPVLRADYDRACKITTPVAEARALLAQFRAADEALNPGKQQS